MGGVGALSRVLWRVSETGLERGATCCIVWRWTSCTTVEC